MYITSDGRKPDGLMKRKIHTDSHSPRKGDGTDGYLLFVEKKLSTTPAIDQHLGRSDTCIVQYIHIYNRKYPIKDVFTCSGYHLSPCRVH